MRDVHINTPFFPPPKSTSVVLHSALDAIDNNFSLEIRSLNLKLTSTSCQHPSLNTSKREEIMC